MNDNQKAASILRQYAGELYQGHTIGGEWDGEHIKAEHDELIALADRLALAHGGEAVSKEPSPEFTEWLLREIPPGTVISSPKWWLPRIWRRATEGLCHPASSADRVAELEAQLAESRERVARAYGLLWHVNAGIDAPWGTPSLTPERAAMESRKVLRDMLTSEQRGDGINAARDLMKALAAEQENKNDE